MTARRRALLPALLLGAVLSACGGEDAATAPVVALGAAPDVADAPYKANPRPYDPALDANAAVSAALAEARRDDKLVLVAMGGNWCPDCRILSGMMDIPAMAEMIEAEYAVVKVDVGEPVAEETGGGFAGYERNADVAARFGAEGFEGVPTLLIVTPEGELLNADEPSIFRNARDRNPQDLADYLAKYADRPA